MDTSPIHEKKQKIQKQQKTEQKLIKQQQNEKQKKQNEIQKKSFKKIFTLLDSLVTQQNKNPSKNQNTISKQNSKNQLNDQNYININKQNKIHSLSDIFHKKLLGISQNQQEKANNAKEISDQVFKKLLSMSNSLALQTTSTNIQQPNGYFKDNIIKVNPHKIDQKQTSQQSIKQNQQITSLWLGQVFDKCASSSFMHFISRNLDYNETKTYCCQQILSNLIESIRDGKSLQVAHKVSSHGMISNKNQNKKQIVYEQQPMRYINLQSSRILDHLCNKYPQSDVQGVNKKVEELAKSLKIDNWMDDEYDLLRLSDINFVYKLTGDYSKQIMKALNLIIELPFKQHRKNKQYTNYKQFQLTMSKIFEIIYMKQKNDINMVINQNGQFDLQPIQKINQTEEEIQYRQKVKSYTNIAIGSKISGATKPFNQQQIQSQIIKIQNNAVGRVLDKWAQQLGSKFFEAQKHILNRKYRFKSKDNKKFNKIPQDMKQKLFKILCEKKKKLQKFIQQLKQSIYDLSNKLAKNESSDVSQLFFLDDREKKIGQFAVKMAQSSSQYFIQVIQKQISLLLQSVDQMKKYWVLKHKFTESPVYQSLNINLITFKIGDLMRCKMISNEDQIIRVLKLFKILSQMWDQKFIKIIRVKNRLEYGNRDILINFMFDGLCPCELQLAVAQKTTQKKQYFDKFNHFLYELKRAYLGPIMEMCKIWTQYESKSQTYAKQIEKSTKKKLKKQKKSIQPFKITQQTFNSVYEYKFPFLCEECNIFTPRNNLIYFNLLINGKIYCGNCIKIKIYNNFNNILQNNFKQIQIKKNQQIKKKYILKKYFNRYPNFDKFAKCLKQIKSFNQDCKQSYQINIPIKSHSIHMIFSMLVQLQRTDQEQQLEDSRKKITKVTKITNNNTICQYVYVSTKFKSNGSLEQQMRNIKYWKQKKDSYETSMQNIQQLQETLQQNFISYDWSVPTHLLPLPDHPTEHYLQLIDKFIPFIHKIEQEKGEKCMKIGAVEVQKNKYYYIPFFIIDELKISEQLIHKGNVELIYKTLDHKQQVLELSIRKITTQFEEINKGIKLKIAYTVRELYLNKNYLKNIDFIEHFHMLKILQANNNLIQKIPNITYGLQQLKLDFNKINAINNINANLYQQKQKYKLKMLSLSNNFIKKIENIENLVNLKYLSLLKNKIKKIQNLPSGLERISLMQNQITKIQNLSHICQLNNISLTSNLINKIQNLQECKSLTVLILNRNNIPTIENMNGLQNIRTLHLSNTGLDSSLVTDEKNNCYKGLKQIKKIKKLMMQNNKIKNFKQMMGFLSKNEQTGEIYANDAYIQLQQISLASNQITNVDDFQKIMPRISVLNLQNNSIKEMNNLLKLGMLMQLNLSKNSISQLPKTGWQKLFKIQYINLNENKIKVIPKLQLQCLLFCKYLYLQKNEITRVQAFPNYPYGIPDFSREIYLSNNKLFDDNTSQQDFNHTLEAIKKINQQSILNLTNNGNCMAKINLIKSVKLQYNLQNTMITLEESINL